MSEGEEIKSNTKSTRSYNNLDPNAKNWPPCKPLFRQDIKTDIPSELRMIVRLVFFHWFYTVIFLFFNMITGLAAMITNVGDYLGSFIGSLIWLILWSPVCFMFYRFLYKAAWKKRSVSYVIFFAGAIAQIIMSAFAATGLTDSGLLGLIQMIDLLKSNKGVGIMALVNSLGFILNIIFLVIVCIRLRIAFKKAGGVQAAKDQAVEEAVGAAVETAKENPEFIASVNIKNIIYIHITNK